MRTPPTTKIGDKWARNISIAFQEWSDKTKLEGRSNTPIIRFDPTPFIEGAFFESGAAQLTELGKLLGTGIKFDLRSPEAEAWIKKYAAQEIKYIEASQKQAIRQIVLRGFEEGLTPQQQSILIRKHIGLLPQHVIAVQKYRDALGDIDPALADRLEEKYRRKLLKWRADTIGLTEGHTASNQGNREANKGAVDRGIFSPDEWERYWMVTRDKRTCPACERLSGARAALPDGDFEGNGSGPPLHQRCLLPGTRCIAPGGGIAMIRQPFSGNAIELTTSNGAKITVTPDHMFLTPRGFAAANLLHEGDNIFYCPDAEGPLLTSPNNHRHIPSIDEIFDALAISFGMRPGIMPPPTKYLYGDEGFDDSNIDIIRPDCLLEDAFKTAINEHVSTNNFNFGDASKPNLTCPSLLTLAVKRLRDTTLGIMGGIRESHPFFKARLSHPQEHRFALASGLEPIAQESSINDVPAISEMLCKGFGGHPRIEEADEFGIINNTPGISGSFPYSCIVQSPGDCGGVTPEVLCDCSDSLTGLITLNEITHIDIKFYHGYVYDIESISTLLICNGIITSNCRCTEGLREKK